MDLMDAASRFREHFHRKSREAAEISMSKKACALTWRFQRHQHL